MNEKNDWFSIEQIDGETFAISEYGHWERPHSYLLAGRERTALIDTGLGVDNIKAVVAKLTTKPITVLTTHAHWDHIGGHGLFEDLRVHDADRDWLEHGLPLPPQAVRSQLLKEPFTRQPPPAFDPERYTVFKGNVTSLLTDGEKIDLGGRILTILHTPGHSPGHVCVYDESRAYLATGDLLYAGTLYASYPSTDPKAFAASIHKIASLKHVAKLLPGHNELALPADTIAQAETAFSELAAKGLLRHGSGLHRFEHFSVLF